jgi:hypothetical protein
MVYFKELSLHLLDSSEGNHDEPHTRIKLWVPSKHY